MNPKSTDYEADALTTTPFAFKTKHVTPGAAVFVKMILDSISIHLSSMTKRSNFLSVQTRRDMLILAASPRELKL